MENIELVINTKSVLNVLGPIGAAILKLKENVRPFPCKPSTIQRLVKECDSLCYSSEHLKDIIITEAEKLNDNLLSIEIKKIHLSLNQCILRLTNSTKDLIWNHETEAVTEVWDHIIFDSEEILGCLVRMLISWDQAYLRRINADLDSFLDSVNDYKNASLSILPTKLEVVILKLEKALVLIEKRCHNLCNKLQHETLTILALQLHSSLRFLTKVLPFASCSSHCNEGKLTQNLIINKMKDLVEEIKKEACFGSQNYQLQEPGKFTNTINELFGFVTVNRGERGIDKLPLLDTIKLPLENTMKHCLCIALSVSPEEYSSMMVTCEDVLEQIQMLSRLEESESPNPNDVDVVLDEIADVLEALEFKINGVLMKQIIKVLTEPDLIAESLINKIENMWKNNEDINFGDRKEIESLVSDFEKEVDDLYQVGGHVISYISDSRKVRQIECSLAMIGWLEAGFIRAAVRAVSENPPQSLFEVNALLKLWKDEVSQLRDTIYLLMESDALLQVTKQEIHVIWSESRKLINHCNSSLLKIKSQRIRALVTHLITLDQEDLLNHNQKKMLGTAVLELKKYESKLTQNNVEEKVGKSLLKRFQYILTLISRISSPFNRMPSAQSVGEPNPFGHGSDDADEAYDSQANGELFSNLSAVEVDVSDGEGKDTDIVFSSLFISTEQKTKNKSTERALRSKDFSSQSNLKDQSLKITRKNTFKKFSQDYLKEGKKECLLRQDDTPMSTTGIGQFLLGQSLSTFRNSTRASKRNFSLKVKETAFDIGELVNISVKEAVKCTSPCTQSGDDAAVSNLTDIITKMERFTATFSTSVTNINELNGSSFCEKENKLRKIGLSYRSTDPLLSGDSTSDEQPTQQEHLKVPRIHSVREDSTLQQENEVLEKEKRTKNECTSNIHTLNSSSSSSCRKNLKNTSELVDSIKLSVFEKEVSLETSQPNRNYDNDAYSSQSNSLNSIVGVSNKKISSNVLLNGNERFQDFSNSFQVGDSISPSNSELVGLIASSTQVVDTPQRLYDLKLVEQRLNALKSFQ